MNAPKNALVVATPEAPAVAGEYVPSVSVTLEQAKDNFKRLHEVTKELMKPGVDYDTIPGTPKPTLLKPGAEHLLQFFGLGHRVARVETKEDWDNGFFYYCYRVTIFKTRIMPNGTVVEQVIAECEGSANSKEKRYRNQDVYTIVNTLQKMAIKRALVGATLQATGTSGMFTQDLEDMDDVGNAKAAPDSSVKRSSSKTSNSVGSVRKAAEQELATILTAIGAKNPDAAARKRWGKAIAAMPDDELTAHIIEGRTYLLSKAAESRGIDGDYALQKLAAGKGLDEMTSEEFKRVYEILTTTPDAELASLLADDDGSEIDDVMADVNF